MDGKTKGEKVRNKQRSTDEGRKNQQKEGRRRKD